MINIVNKTLKKIIKLSKLDDLSIKGMNTQGTNINRKKYEETEILELNHFTELNALEHPCRHTMVSALKRLNKKEALILETGSSAWGTNSSLLFDSYINSFGGTFETVDLRIQPLINLRKKCTPKTILHCDDSVIFLKKWSLKNPNRKIDLLYLDSWDVDWSNPNASAIHGLAEFLAVSNHLVKGSLLLIDDTPRDENNFLIPWEKNNYINYKYKNGFYPGKGSLVKLFLQSLSRGQEIDHKYQLLWEF